MKFSIDAVLQEVAEQLEQGDRLLNESEELKDRIDAILNKQSVDPSPITPVKAAEV